MSIISDPFLGMTLILGLKVGTQNFCPSIFESVTLAVCVQRTKTRKRQRFEVGKRMQKVSKGCVTIIDILTLAMQFTGQVEMWTNLGGDACHVEDLREVHLH